MGYFFLLPWNRPSRNPPLQRFKHVGRQTRVPIVTCSAPAASDDKRRPTPLDDAACFHTTRLTTYLPMVGLEPTISSLGGRRLIH